MTSVAHPESSWRYPGWRVVAVCFALAVFAWGFGFYGHAFYLAELQRRHGWPSSVVAGATTAYYLASASLLAFVGDAMRRFGARATTLAGIAAMAGAAALVPTVSAPWQLFAVYALMACGWAATSLAAITTVLGAWFARRRGLAISLGLTGASFGGVIVVPVLAVLSNALGFAPAVWIVASVSGALVATLVAIVFVDPPKPEAAPAAAPRETSRRDLLGSGAFWSVSGPFALAYFAQVGFLVHQIAVLEPSVGRAAAGVAVAVTTGMAVAGRVGLGVVVDRLDQRVATALSFASQALALAIVAISREPWALIAASAAFGVSVGNVITLPSLIVQREFDARSFSRVIGLSTAICQVAYSFGPGLLGLLRDATGGYLAPLAVCAALDALAAAAILLFRRRQPSGAA